MLDKINLVKDTWKTLEDLASTSDFSQSRKHLTDRNAYDTKILVVIGATPTDIIGSTYKMVHDFCDLLLVMCMDHRKMNKAFRLSKATVHSRVEDSQENNVRNAAKKKCWAKTLFTACSVVN